MKCPMVWWEIPDALLTFWYSSFLECDGRYTRKHQAQLPPSYLVSAYTDNSPSLQWRAPLWFSSHYLEGGHALNTLSVINTFPWNTFIKLVLTENWDPWRNRLEAQSSLRWQNFVYSNSLLFDTWFLDHQRYLAWVHSPANQSPYNW